MQSERATAVRRQGTIEVGAVRLGYTDAGDVAAPPVLLLHGSGSKSPTWGRFRARLGAEGYRTIAVDLRGHGTSAPAAEYALDSLKDDVIRLLDEFDLQDAVLVGHSVGAHAALAAAIEAPERIARLVLEDLAAPPMVASRPTLGGAFRALSAGRGIVTQQHDYELRAVVSLVRQLARPDAAWWARLPRVVHPTLVLSGGPSSCIPPQRLADVVGLIPDARLATIPVGHRVHSLAPEPFAAEVLAFLGRTAPAEAPLVAGEAS